MKMLKALRKVVENAKLSDAYWVEKAKLNFSVALEGRRRAKNMSYKDVAEKIGTSQPYITKVFRGDANLTIETMVKLARATGAHIDIQIVDAEPVAKVWRISAPGLRLVERHTTPTGATETVVSGGTAANPAPWHLEDNRLAA